MAKKKKRTHWTQTPEGRARMSKIQAGRHRGTTTTNGASGAAATLMQVADLLTRLEAENKKLREQVTAVDAALARSRR